MNERIFEVIQGLLSAISAYLAMLEEICLHHAVNGGDQPLDAYVELAVHDQHRLFNLFLHHPIGPLF